MSNRKSVKMSRRDFMIGCAGVVGGSVGLTAGVSTLSKAEEPLKAKVKDLCSGQNGTLCPRCKFNCKAEEPKEIELTAYGTEPDKEYDLIADLVEEMKEFDKKLPDTIVRYTIHCNYTGLAFLSDTNELEKEGFYEGIEGVSISHRGYTHGLWIPYSQWMLLHQKIDKILIDVMVRPNLPFCLGLIAQYRKIKPYYHNEIPTFELVTTRCFNVDREEEGKKIAMGGWRPTPLQKMFQTRCKEALKSGQPVYFINGVTKEGTPWVEPIRHKDFYKNG